MPNIYQLSDDYLMLADRLANTADEDGVVDESLLPIVSEAKELVESKAKSIGCVIKQLSAYKAQVDNENERLSAMSKTLEGRIDYLKKAMSAVLIACDIKKIESVQATISFKKSEQTVVYDESALPPEYVAIKTTTSPDKTKIKNAIKSGQIIPGAYVESRQNIQIK